VRSARVSLVFVALVSGAAAAHAQAQRPRAELIAVALSAPVRPGSTVKLSLKVKLPKDVHVQANKPRDPSLIPTVLTLDAPAGVKVEKIVYPAPTELAQKGRSDTLAVLGPEFAIDVDVAIAAGVASGNLAVPARLRYQACNDAVCFPPATATAEWKLSIP
jgi:thioredoxin:protein disulfide reductase